MHENEAKKSQMTFLREWVEFHQSILFLLDFEIEMVKLFLFHFLTYFIDILSVYRYREYKLIVLLLSF